MRTESTQRTCERARAPAAGGTSRQTAATAIACVLLAAAALATPISPLSAQTPEVALCDEAARFVREDVGMVAVVEPDTIDDWRTHRMVPGCRVTAAGATRGSDTEVARGFYEQVRAAEWLRTPDPRDAPNEGSLRFRHEEADCLFNYYTAASPLNTEAEFAVGDAVPLRSGERHYYFLVMCTPAGPAAPRG